MQGRLRHSNSLGHISIVYTSVVSLFAMDTRFVLHGIVFIWDEDKAALNLRQHGIPFEQAAEAFFDPLFKLVDASRNEEVRDAIIGMDGDWNLLFVVHIERKDETIRLVSARRASRKERRDYEI